MGCTYCKAIRKIAKKTLENLKQLTSGEQIGIMQDIVYKLDDKQPLTKEEREIVSTNIYEYVYDEIEVQDDPVDVLKSLIDDCVTMGDEFVKENRKEELKYILDKIVVKIF